jgi:hypothetical protein
MPKFEISVEPFGENNLPSDYLFMQRKYYKVSDEIYPIDMPKPIDIWYERPLFGKVDTLGRPVFPDSSLLKPIRNNKFAINFVADAYNDFALAADTAIKSLRTCMSSILDVTKPVKAWADVTDKYHEYYLNVVHPPFGDFLLNNLSHYSKINNFSDFIDEFLAYAKSAPSLAFTKTAYMLSNRISNACSGLIIEFATDGYDNDNIKWKNYLSSDFFTDYARLAASYGFYINKHIPWSIVANLNSQFMKQYMEPYGLTTREEMFATNYYQSEYLSYEALKSYLYGSYITIISTRPYINKIKTSNCVKNDVMSSLYKTKVTRRPREVEFSNVEGGEMVPSYEKFLEMYSERFLFGKYVRLRLIENGLMKAINKKISNRIIKRVMNKFDQSGIFQATIFLSEIILQQKRYLTSLKENNSL